MMEITDKERESAVRKIQKALALASNNPSIQEAETALLKAQELMVKYGIASSEVGNTVSEKEVIEGYVVDTYEDIEWWHREIADVIANNFKCYFFTRSIKDGRKTKYKMVFLGLKEDVEICKELYGFIETSLSYYSQQYVTLKKIKVTAQKKMVKNDYIRGFIKGLDDKFKEQVDRNGWGLVLVKDALVTQKYDTYNLKTVNTKYKHAGDQDAVNAGYERGKSLEKDRTAIAGDSRHDFFKQFEGKVVKMVAKAEAYNNFRIVTVHDKSISGLDEEGRQKAFWFYDINHMELVQAI